MIHRPSKREVGTGVASVPAVYQLLSLKQKSLWIFVSGSFLLFLEKISREFLKY